MEVSPHVKTMVCMSTSLVHTPTTPTAFQSFRRRIVAWFIALMALTLAIILLTTRTVLLNAVTEQANADVVQEAREFTTFAAEGRDPETSQEFESPERLLQVFLARQIPGDNEALVGVSGDQIIQMANIPRPLQAGEPLVTSALENPAASGIYDDPELGPVHWATVGVEGTDTALLIARFTDTARASVAANLRSITLISLGSLLLALALAWFVAGRLLNPVRQVREAAVGLDSRSHGQRVPLPDNGDADTVDLARTFNTLLERIDAADDAYRGILARLHIQLRDWLNRVRGGADPQELAEEGTRTLATLSALGSLTVGSRDTNQMVTMPAHDVGRRVQEHIAAAGVPVTLVASASESSAVTLDVNAVGLSMTEAARFCAALSTPVELGVETKEHGLSLWVRERGVGCDPTQLKALLNWQPDETRPEGRQANLVLLRCVADAHGGSAWAQSTNGLGTIIGLDLPGAPAHE